MMSHNKPFNPAHWFINKTLGVLIIITLLFSGFIKQQPTKAQAPAPEPYLVKDINLDTSQVGSDIYQMVNLDGALYFRASDGIHGEELWKSDGTISGTGMVRDINPASLSSTPSDFVAMNGEVYFSADDGEHGNELWKTDGTRAGTVIVKDIYPDKVGSDPYELLVMNSELYFFAKDFVSGFYALWKSDGTTNGTVLVSSLYYSWKDQAVMGLSWNGIFLFAYLGQLWKSDGTPAGTTMVSEINPGGSSDPANFIALGDAVYFSAINSDYGNELWKTDGTEAGTVMVKDINPGADFGIPSGSFQFIQLNNILYFAAMTAGYDCELWKSDGTEAGTVLVKDINPGINSSCPRHFVNINGELFFTTDDGVHGDELWNSDGTEAGTVLVKDINLGFTPSMPYHFVNVNGELFFTANDGTHGDELWKSDGSAIGTMLVADIRPGVTSSDLSELTAFNGTLYFRGNEGLHGMEFWRSDGAAAGTTLVMDINPGNSSASVGPLTAMNGAVFFAANDGVHGSELWRSDGREAGTFLVKDTNPGIASGIWPWDFLVIGDTLFFSANDGVHGLELWKSDGTAEGTVMVKDINPDGDSIPRNLVNLNGTLFFSARQGELWKSDGTEEGTILIKSIPSGIRQVVVADHRLFISNYDIWISDGTSEGTTLVKSFPNIGCGHGGCPTISSVINLNGIGFFGAQNLETYNADLWKTDGTETGTTMVKDVIDTSGLASLFPWDDMLYFIFYNISGYQLWKTDGSEAGTTVVKDFQSGYPESFAGLSDTLYFITNLNTNCTLPDCNGSLWKTDGTEAGTFPVNTIGTQPYNLTEIYGTLFFTTATGLWKSDGTQAGTFTIKNDFAEVGGSVPPTGVLNANGGKLFFVASDGIHGNELWALDLNQYRVTIPLVQTKYTIPDTLIHMLFNEPAGATTFSDSSTYANTGTCTGSACPTSGQPGHMGSALHFDGVDDVVTIPDRPELNISAADGLSIEAWVFLDSADCGYCRITNKFDGHKGFAFDAGDNSGVLRPAFYISDGVHAGMVRSAVPLSLNRWHRLKAVFARGQAYPRLFIDGYEPLYEAKWDVSAVGDLSNNAPLLVGHLKGENVSFSGLIDELIFNNKGLSQ
jgi:ELWxxDGT repeat protein